MGPGNQNFLDMCIDSVKGADKVLYFTSGDSPFVEKGYEVYGNDWDESDPNTNGKSRNVYLKHLKENYPNDWCLVLDEDEILEDQGIEKIKQIINKIKDPMILSPRIRHFIGDLGHEDATRDIHFVPNRLFKITDNFFDQEH